jgi:predicted alpha/beta hydrolase family esterase
MAIIQISGITNQSKNNHWQNFSLKNERQIRKKIKK